MATWIHFSLIYFLSIVMLLYCVIEQRTTGALTIKLIHRYAPESPFHTANLTDHEIGERLNLHTRTRKQYTSLISSTREAENGTSLNLEDIRPHLELEINPPLSAFLVKVSIGTFSSGGGVSQHKSYYLDLDTAGTITWLQCEDCKRSPHHCYRQIEPPFPNSKSSSYTPLPCGRNPLCFPNECIGDSCSYYVEYADGSHTIGILAHENFAFPSSTGHEEIVRLVFGCGIDNKKPYAQERDLKMAGIFGLGWGPHSFVTQINSISQGRFAYCLPSTSQAAQGGVPILLRFGSDIPLYSTLPRTRLTKYQDDASYYVKLLDISINGARLNIPSHYFLKRGPDEGGCIFDTASTATRVSPSSAYQMVKRAVETHIARFVTSLEMVSGMFGYDLCYRASKPFRQHSNLPSITFHFEGNNADLVLKPETAFINYSHHIRYNYICLEMVPEERMTVIGSNAQANHFIVYDLPSRKLYFGPRDCSRNP
ncbi:unnamed protein product [Rhodiola kirilowii]